MSSNAPNDTSIAPEMPSTSTDTGATDVCVPNIVWLYESTDDGIVSSCRFTFRNMLRHISFHRLLELVALDQLPLRIPCPSFPVDRREAYMHLYMHPLAHTRLRRQKLQSKVLPAQIGRGHPCRVAQQYSCLKWSKENTR
jgi:hypothetical protein